MRIGRLGKLSTPCATAPTVADSTATLASAVKSTPLVTRFLPDLVARAVLRRGHMSGYHRGRWRPRHTGEWADESRAVGASTLVAPWISALGDQEPGHAIASFTRHLGSHDLRSHDLGSRGARGAPRQIARARPHGTAAWPRNKRSCPGPEVRTRDL